MSAEWVPLAGAVMGSVGALLGWFVPNLVARIPEPLPEQVPLEVDVPAARGTTEHETVGRGSATSPSQPGTARALPSPSVEPVPHQERGTDEGRGSDVGRGTDQGLASGEEPKVPYADIAGSPGLAWRCALVTALALGLAAARTGWDPVLLPLTYLAPVGVALGLVDWRTRLLPTKVIAPSYAVLAVLVVLAAALSGDWDALLRAGLGWLAAGATFFVLWLVYPRGMGYGDVRLSGLLGLVLGYLGWAELVTGLYAAFLIGGVGGLLLSALKVVDRKAYPFGPFMLVGALVGVLLGPGVAAWYA